MNPAQIAQAIRDLTQARGPGKTICPSEVERHLSPADWRPLMPRVREVASALQQRGEICITQQGVEVDPLTCRGPIRLSLRESDV